MPDEIIEELWRIKDSIAREHGNDVRKLAAHLPDDGPTPKLSRIRNRGMPEQSESISNTDDQWVPSLLKTARKNNPSVTAGVFDSLEQLLIGPFSERDLTPTNLKSFATQLIADMVPGPSEPGETQ